MVGRYYRSSAVESSLALTSARTMVFANFKAPNLDIAFEILTDPGQQRQDNSLDVGELSIVCEAKHPAKVALIHAP